MRKPVRSSLRFFPVCGLTLTLLAGWVPAALQAQSSCEVLLAEAEKSYEEGNFEKVPELLEACTRQASRERVRIYAMLAKAYVMADRLHLAALAAEDLLRIEPDYQPDQLRDPSRYIRLIEEVKAEMRTVQVSSVSKTAESLREAPATVMVVTAEDIARRGYLDLEAVLHDIPGFDISRLRGAVYSNIYQRGLRSDFTTRTLLLIDGVEENELWGNVAYIARQYPLSNIERVEVVHGPASTIYGANAFAGVISVITKTPDSIITDGKRFGADVRLTGGEWDTRSAEATVAGRNRNDTLQWSLTARSYESNDFDLSGFPDWDYDTSFYDSFDYGNLLNISGTDAGGNFLAQRFLTENNLGDSPYYTIQHNGDVATAIELTAEGARRAAALDKIHILNGFEGEPITSTSHVDDWALEGKLNLSNLSFGFMTWWRNESNNGSYTDRSILGGSVGTCWCFRFNRFYIKYTRRLSRTLTLDYFGRYKDHEMANESFFPFTQSYAGGQRTLLNLVEGVPSSFGNFFVFAKSSQWRNEMSVVYTPFPKLNVVSGVEVRQSTIPGDLNTSISRVPEETGSPGANIPGGNSLTSTDLGLYAQATYSLRNDLKLILGGRVDDNKVRTTGGFGTVFTPRVALVYTKGNWVFKSIYAEAFQAPTNFQRFVTTPGTQELPAVDLTPEEVKNIEFSANWQPSPNLSFDASIYDSSYSAVIQVAVRPCDVCTLPTTLQFDNIGSLEVRGAQLTARYRWKNLLFAGSYWHTDSVSPDPQNPDGSPRTDAAGNLISEAPAADIAQHHVNFELNAELGNFNGNLRFNFVSDRDSGSNTTAPANAIEEFESHIVANLALSYKFPTLGLTAQLLANNLFDDFYYDPGGRDADGTFFSSAAPQPGRSIFGKLLFSF